MKKILAILTICFVTLLSSSMCFASALGNFNASTINGGITNQGVFARADLTMVNVWATFCAPCKEEMPALQTISEAYKGKGFQIIGIVTDTADEYGRSSGPQLAEARRVATAAGVTYTNIIPTSSMYSGLLGSVVAVPTTFFIDKEGNQVGELYLGAKTETEWLKIIESLR